VKKMSADEKPGAVVQEC